MGPDAGVLVLVGYLVTHPDGHQARMGADKARADAYAAQYRGTIEAMYVLRQVAKLG